MTRVLLGMTAVVTATLLAGCPVYSDGGTYRVCNEQGCFDCPDKEFSEANCTLHSCSSYADCGGGLVCNSQGFCGPTNAPAAGAASNQVSGTCTAPSQCGAGSTCGMDGSCHAGDCGGAVGCPSGFSCVLYSNLGPQCIPALAFEDGGSDATIVPEAASNALDAALNFADATSLGDVAEASNGSDAQVDVADAAEGLCNADSDCSGEGARCVNGRCSTVSRLCSDGTQCAASGLSCVNGLCTPVCSPATACPAGYGCDFTLGVCSVNPFPCAATSDCPGGAVCVESHCAAPCEVGDGASCPASQVCVHGGCIPDQHAIFDCYNDGQSGALANSCPEGTICLHGDCYAACSPEGGACGAGLGCKQVTVSRGTFAVCGGQNNLGSACDYAVGLACTAGELCIDGFCR